LLDITWGGRHYREQNTKLPARVEAMHAFISGAAAGSIAAALTTPFDVVKTRRQTVVQEAQTRLKCNKSSALYAKRRKEFTNDGSPRGFAPSSSKRRGFDLNNGKERNITSVKDVDAALNDEIEGALASAEMDLMASSTTAAAKSESGYAPILLIPKTFKK
jgi:hypothetical protein